jgi:hypothetical protein
MTEPKTYTTHLDIKFDPLALIDVDQLAKSVTDQWYNQTLCRVNDSVVRLGVMQGEYHWHKHENDDEFFYVLSGRFIIDLEGRSVELLPNQGFVVPKGRDALHAGTRKKRHPHGRDGGNCPDGRRVRPFKAEARLSGWSQLELDDGQCQPRMTLEEKVRSHSDSAR